jgi:hypothetical protein
MQFPIDIDFNQNRVKKCLNCLSACFMHKLLITTFILLGIKTGAQNDTSSVERGKLYITPMPVLGSNPAYGFIYGAAANGNIVLGDVEKTRMSNSTASLTYTSRNQLISLIKSNIYLNEDKWILFGDWRFFDTSQPTFGLGTGPQSKKLAGSGFEYEGGFLTEPIPSEQLMEFTFFRFHETALRRVREGFYAGLGLHLDYHYKINDKLLDLSSSPPVVTSHYAYSVGYGFNPERYRTIGVSLNAVYDRRDNPATPYSGEFIWIRYRINPHFLGSSQSSSDLWMEYRDYFPLSKKSQPSHLLGIWTYGHFRTTGRLPYLHLPSIGWDLFGRSGRGYTQGRFRGEDMVYGEVEYRARIAGTEDNPNLFGAVVFVNATTASNDGANIGLFDYLDPAYGFGLRLMLNKKARVNVTIDYAWGNYGAQGLFLNVTEAF